jgi:hypothetical protein
MKKTENLKRPTKNNDIQISNKNTSIKEKARTRLLNS